jgi:hypothetical protein
MFLNVIHEAFPLWLRLTVWFADLCRCHAFINFKFKGKYRMSIQSNGAKIAALSAFMAFSMSANAETQKAPAMDTNSMVHCTGVHACKGNSDCKTAQNSCKGMNACKGQGFKAMSAMECKDKGGKVAKS